MFWEILSGVCVLVLGGLIMFYFKKRISKKARDKEILEQLNRSVEKIMHNQTHQGENISEMRKELHLNRVDSQCAIYALEMASNGNNFKANILSKRKELMGNLNFQYKD